MRAALLLEARTRFESPGQCVVVAEVDVEMDGEGFYGDDEREGVKGRRRMVVGFAYWVRVGGGSGGFGFGPGPSGTGDWYWEDTWGKSES